MKSLKNSLAKPLSNFHQPCSWLVWSALVFLGSAACSHSQEATEQPAIELLRSGASLLDRGEYAKAAEKAKAAADLTKDSPMILQRSAEILYLSGHTKESLPLFDRVVQLVPEAAPQNWQRGIALCSAGKFAEGAKQFETHHTVNPDDVENSAWYFLCIAKTQGIDAARKTVIPSRGDGRQPMMSVLQMLQQKLEPEQVLAAAEANTPEGEQRRRAQFYAALYVGLYFDSLGDAQQAAKYLKQSLSYGDSGYMVDTARVYLADRFPSVTSDKDSRQK